ncbi:MAGUK p55 subfamily member 2-like isoform X2 [Agrilus planipennis]|uniref:MAGUK p55 subfamily member 2-like isoform X2 n=1 Tax=Agrilus planipennis TaxID=224129 RepID=A0A7F5R3K1_AGRPL|nr:MAGUK p55 subfamily member 2-like isoform X2 [Agrilus planipennis]
MVSFTKNQEHDRRQLLASMNEMTCYNNYHQIENAAFQHVRDNIEKFDTKEGVKETDLIFLKEIMDNCVLKNLVKVQDKLEELSDPVSLGNENLTEEIVSRCNKSLVKEAKELADLLSKPHVKAVIRTHDTIGEKRLKFNEKINSSSNICNIMTGEALRVVGVRKKPGEPLGLTVSVDAR